MTIDVNEKYLGRESYYLKVVELVYKDTGTRRKLYLRCLCKCGNYTDVEPHKFMSGNTKSCGCLLLSKRLPTQDDKKQCSQCGEFKPFTEFNKKRGGLQPICKECNKKNLKADYEKNPQKYIDKKNKRKFNIREFIDKIKQTKVCEKCGECHSECLEFHHRDPSKKLFPLSEAAATGYGEQKLLEEIAKCAVLCSNDHRKFHRLLSSLGKDEDPVEFLNKYIEGEFEVISKTNEDNLVGLS